VDPPPLARLLLPANFLLPLFVVTLVANAFLVAFAIRGMRRGQQDADRPSWSGRPAAAAPLSGRETPQPVEPAAPPTGDARSAVARAGAVEPAEPAEPEPAVDPDPKARPTEAATEPRQDAQSAPVVEESDHERAAELATPPAPKRRRATKAAGGASTTRSGSAEPRRARRRFSLPPLDDDHEKTNRSIESFLGGVVAPASGPSTPEAAPASTPPASTPPASTPPARGVSGPTTVALIAVVGPPDGRSAGGARGRTPTGTAATLAMVERTLRGAARGSDVVTIGRRGRFQIVLPATGELAARAYLRRIRAAIEPGLEAVDPSLHLAVATATVLDEPLEDAARRAEDRLSLATDAAHDSDRETRRVTGAGESEGGPGRPAVAPRAAPD
jgi:hypothetical protein